MTAKPTLTLDASEWRSLLASNFARANDYVAQNEKLEMVGLKALHQHLDRMKALASAWHYSQHPKVEEKPEPAVPVKKRRGRPPKNKVVEATVQS